MCMYFLHRQYESARLGMLVQWIRVARIIHPEAKRQYFGLFGVRCVGNSHDYDCGEQADGFHRQYAFSYRALNP